LTKVDIEFLFFVYKLCFLLGNTESVDPPRKINLLHIDRFFLLKIYMKDFLFFYLIIILEQIY